MKEPGCYKCVEFQEEIKKLREQLEQREGRTKLAGPSLCASCGGCNSTGCWGQCSVDSCDC